MKLLALRCRYALFALAGLASAIGGCSGVPDPSGACSTPSDAISLLAYPALHSTGDPASLRTLILGMPAEAVQLTIAGGSPGATPIATTPTALPSPLPSPLTPEIGMNPPSDFFAVSVPQLAPATTYHVQALETVFTCTSSSKQYVSSGSFSTQ